MFKALKVMPLANAFLLAVVLSSGHFGLAGVQDESRPTRSARGGTLARTGRHQFETFFYTTGLRVFPLNSAGAPIDASKLTGTATFYHPNSPKPWFSRPLHGTPVTAGQTSSSLDLSIGLDTVPPTGAKVTFEIAGLTDPAEPTAEFTVPFEFTKVPADSSAIHPAPLTGVVATSPRYVYGPGYSGFGYYQYPGPEAAPSPSSNPTVYGYGTPSSGYSGSSGRTHDWSTGRDYQGGGLISKPWLRPMD
jgi:hypothetical protein